MNAFVDLRTRKIIGAERNSLAWFHEKGHLVYNDSEFGMRNDFRAQVFFNATIFFLVLALFFEFFKLCAALSFILFAYFSIYEEAWCWRYAFEERKKLKFKSAGRYKRK